MMYAFLRGILDKKTQDSFIIDVGGVGYKVFTPASALCTCVSNGSEIKLFTHHYVREDTQALYGFLSEEELKMFEQLISVSGIGPKAALSLVSTIIPSQFGLAVLTEDADRFTKAPGIGKKTAERLVLELYDKISKNSFKSASDISTQTTNQELRVEAIQALCSLGFSRPIAEKSVNVTLMSETTGITLEELIKKALKTASGN